QAGFDPGTEWGTGDTSTADNTLRRELSSCGPDTNPTDVFDPAVIYAGYPTNTFDGLGNPGNLTCGGSGCEQSLSATLDDTNPSPGDVITSAVTVTNDAASPAPLDLWLDATGPVSRTVRLGSGTL